ncbi:MAG TPA: acyl-CoA dehydrogenase family protein, partial [Acidimicrobiales bacterium]|nr:acyl-CoA dehydrogenase family protein [Acidimicrobiales bacterium]
MIEWSDEQVMIRDAIRQFVEKEIKPHVEELEHGDLPPYAILKKLFSTFGMDAMAKANFERTIAREKAISAGAEPESVARAGGRGRNSGDGGGMTL